MTYKQNFVACIKVNGKILRENGDLVNIPFGSEYTIYLKNLHAVRAMVKISVDGTDATEGTWLIIPANGVLELERFIRNGCRDRGNRFKFIERTAGIEEHRGIGAEDGLIRIEYKLEKVVEKKTVITEHIHHHHSAPYSDPYLNPFRPHWMSNSLIGSSNSQSSPFRPSIPTRSLRPSMRASIGTQTRGGGNFGQSRSANFQGAMNVSNNVSYNSTGDVGEAMGASAFLGDVGITVAGSESRQRFTSGSWFATEDHSHVLVLRIRGAVAGKPVVQAVTVAHKPQCTSCGKQNKAVNKFCSQCGTALQII